MEIKAYAMDLRPGVGADRVHYVTQPDMPGFTICCAACGHYTVVGRHDRRPKPES